MVDDTEKKLAEIFGNARMKVEQARLAGQQYRERRAASFKLSQDHLNATVEPELQRLAGLIEKQGPKVTVSSTGPTSQGPETAAVTLAIFPEGQESAGADEVPYVRFTATHEVIGVHEHAMSPLRGGHSAGAGSFPGTKINARDVERLVLKLVETCFGERRREPRAEDAIKH